MARTQTFTDTGALYNFLNGHKPIGISGYDNQLQTLRNRIQHDLDPYIAQLKTQRHTTNLVLEYAEVAEGYFPTKITVGPASYVFYEANEHGKGQPKFNTSFPQVRPPSNRIGGHRT
jgi:hypothetical protein